MMAPLHHAPLTLPPQGHSFAPPDRGLIITCVLLGLGARLYAMSLMDGVFGLYGSGEATQVAIALAEGRGFADGFFAGQGPTAHVMPVSVAVPAALFALFGPAEPTANLLLGIWTLAQTFGGYLMVHAVFRRLGLDARALAIGFAVLCLLPIFLPQDIANYRFWEGGLALCLAALNLLLMQRIERRDQFGARAMAVVAALSALTFLTSPPVGLAVDACWAVFALRRVPILSVVRFALIAAAAHALVVAPWIARNQAAVGAPVLRSNFGLELAIGNHPDAVDPTDPGSAYDARLAEVHPFHSRHAQAAMRRAGGEVAYARQLGDAAERWIADNPTAFAWLALRHWRQFFVPDPWQMNFSTWPRLQEPRALMLGVVNLLGLAGLAVGIVQRRRGYVLIGVYLLVVSLPYTLVQPIPRYTYLVYPLLVFLAAQFLVDVRKRLVPGVRDRPSA